MSVKMINDETKESVSVAVILQTLVEDICDNYCKYRKTADENCDCDITRNGGSCPLDILI